jgi:glycogen(starch) synthase
MRILHLLDHSTPRHSAYSHRARSLLRQLRVLGWHTIHMTGPAQGLVETVDRNDDDWRYFRTAPPGGLAAQLPLLSGLAAVAAMSTRLRQVARLTRPDLLHAHAPLSNAVAALYAGRRLALPVLIEWPHTGGRAALPLPARQAARLSDAVAVPDLATLRALLAQGIPASRLLLVPEPLSLRRHPPRQPRDPALAAALGLDRGPVIACCGPFGDGDGVELLLSAMPALLRKHPALTVLLVGDGPRRAALAVQAAPFGERVVFAGPVRTDDMPRYQDLADILVWPHPAANSAALAAMARGAVLALGDSGFHRELVDHGSTGLLFEAGNLGAMVEVLDLLLEEPSCWPRLRAAARAHVERVHSFAACAARYGALYERLLEQRTRT